jgi:hypothetical protein
MREYSHGINEFVRDNFPNNKHIFLDYRTDITVIKDENTRKHRPFKEKIKGKI